MNNNFDLKQYLSENRLLGEIEVGMGHEIYFLTPLAKKYIPFDDERYNNIGEETGNYDIPYCLWYIDRALGPNKQDNYMTKDSAFKAWEDTVDDVTPQQYDEFIQTMINTCIKLNLLSIRSHEQQL
jgi:hypothetical protein